MDFWKFPALETTSGVFEAWTNKLQDKYIFDANPQFESYERSFLFLMPLIDFQLTLSRFICRGKELSKGGRTKKDEDRDDAVLSDLELVADADEAEFARLLLRILGAVGVLEKLPDKFVFGLAHQAFQGHVERVVVLLHKPGLRANTRTNVNTYAAADTVLQSANPMLSQKCLSDGEN